ncbi:MAG: TIGR00725 family protein [Dehalococcoidia bacterium]|nr:TIGR00725 family protein [Dehalococcoidia bacterium]MDW8119322.1 TIGR00725 family protein [Chloroflexota bacterium]
MSLAKRPLAIAVIGGGNADAQSMELAYQVGKALARRGVVVVCGGLTGVMEAVCRGAKEAGGITVGILPGHDPQEANPYVDIAICTGMGYARNPLVVKSGQAVIAIDGAYGTLSEIAHALAEGIPVVGLHTWMFSVNNQPDNAIVRASDPEEAVEKAIALARRGQRAPTPREGMTQ